MRRGHLRASVAAGLLGLGLAGCGPTSSYEYYGLDRNIDTYKADVKQGDPLIWKAPLYRVADGPVSGASGTLDIVDIPYFTKWPHSTTREDRYRVRVHLRGMTPLGTFSVAQEGGWAIGLVVETDLHGNGSASHHWSSGFPSRALRVVVKDAGGQVVLAGEVPEIGVHGALTGEYEQPGGGIRLAVRAWNSNASGRESLVFHFSGLEVNQPAELFVQKAGGSLVFAGSFTADERGKGTLAWKSRTGTPLPGEAISVRSLSQVPFEVRVKLKVVIAGTLP